MNRYDTWGKILFGASVGAFLNIWGTLLLGPWALTIPIFIGIVALWCFASIIVKGL